MATITSTGISPARGGNGRSGARASIKTFWREFVARAFHPYRPELYYMRGPGPAWRAKYGEAAAFRLKSRDL
jgi:hypothetical protein